MFQSHLSVCLSVCLSVSNVLTFECFVLKSLFLVCRHVFRIFRVIGSKPRSQEQNSRMCIQLAGSMPWIKEATLLLSSSLLSVLLSLSSSLLARDKGPGEPTGVKCPKSEQVEWSGLHAIRTSVGHYTAAAARCGLAQTPRRRCRNTVRQQTRLSRGVIETTAFVYLPLTSHRTTAPANSPAAGP